MFLAGQIIGAIGIIINFVIFQQPNKKRLLFTKFISDIIWATHYGLIGAYSGMFVAIMCLPREIVFYNRGKNRFVDSPLWLFIFGGINIATAILTWKGVFSLFPACATIIAMIAFWLNNIKLTKILSLFVSCFMMTYDIISHSYMGIVNEIITLISIVIALVLLFRKKRDIKILQPQNQDVIDKENNVIKDDKSSK